MPLQKQTIDLQITGGMNEKVAPETSTIPDLLSNCRYTKTGSLGKRPGSACIGRFNARLGGGAPPPPDAILAYGDSGLVRAGGSDLDSYELRSSTDWNYRGALPLGGIKVSGAASVSTTSVIFDSAVSPDYAWTVVVGNTGYVRITDNATGSVRTVALATAPIVAKVCFATNDVAIVVYPSGVNVVAVALTCSTGSVSSPVNISSFSAPPPKHGFDVCRNTSVAGEVIVATPDSTGANVVVARVSATPAVTATWSFAAASSTYSAAVHERSGYVWVAYDDVNAGTRYLYYRVYTYAGVSSLGATSTTISLGANAAQPFVIHDYGTDALAAIENNSGDVKFCALNVSGTVGTIGTLYRTAIKSKPWQYTAIGNDTVYMAVALRDYSSTGETLMVAKMTTGASWSAVPVGVAMFGQVDASSSTYGQVSSVAPISDTKVRFTVNKFVSGGTSESHASFVDVEKPVSRCMVEAGSDVVGSGAVPWLFDGLTPAESGFPRPKTPTLAAASGGALTSSTTYSFIVVYEWLDANGVRHYSEPSTAASVALGGSDTKVTVTAYNCQFTSRGSGISNSVQVCLYGTRSNGSTYYRVSASANDTTTQTTTFTVTNDPATTSELLYTTGGVLAYQFQPSAKHVATTGNRVWLTDTDDGTVWFSGTQLTGEVPRFNAALTIEPFGDGDFIASAQLDDKVILFKESSIWLTFGEGPDDTGAGSFSPLQVASSDVGCSDPRSIVTVPEGLMFMSLDGLCILTRALQVARVGKPVEDSVGATLTPETGITSAVAVPALAEVRFSSAITTEARAVVYDYYHGNVQQPAWYRYTWTNPKLTAASVSTLNVTSQPAIGGTITLDIDGASSTFFVGEIVYLTTGGYYQVTALPAADQVTVRNLGWDGNVAYNASVGMGTLSPAGKTVASACMHGGLYTWIDRNGYLFQETPGTFLDTMTGQTSQWVTMTARLSYWNPGIVQGFVRVWRAGVVGERKTACDMTINLRHDYNLGSADTSYTWTASSISSLALNQVLARVVKQRCQSIQVEYVDGTPTGASVGTGEGSRISAVSLEVGTMPGIKRLPAAAKK